MQTPVLQLSWSELVVAVAAEGGYMCRHCVNYSTFSQTPLDTWMEGHRKLKLETPSLQEDKFS